MKDYDDQLLSPIVSGTPTAPITLSAYPGATVNIVCTAGTQPLFGTTTPALNYVRFLGFSVDPGPGVPTPNYEPDTTNAPAAFYIAGTSNEVGYCTVIGSYMATNDNHDGIRISTANGAWIHNNNIYGVTGESHNSAGIKIYYSTNLLI